MHPMTEEIVVNTTPSHQLQELGASTSVIIDRLAGLHKCINLHVHKTDLRISMQDCLSASLPSRLMSHPNHAIVNPMPQPNRRFPTIIATASVVTLTITSPVELSL